MDNSTNLKVLIVDDEPLIVEELSEYVESLGFQVISTIKPEDVCDILINDPSINIIITDLAMPKLDGFSLINRINNTLPDAGNLSFIIISGNYDLKDALKAIRVGASEFLTKPLSTELLHHSLERIADTIHSRKLKEEFIIQLELRVEERTIKIEKREREQALILDTMIEAVFCIDEKGNILSINHAVVDMFGYDKDYLLNCNIKEIIPTEHVKNDNDYIAQYVTGIESTMMGAERELHALRSNGEAFIIKLSTTELPMDKGEKARFLSVCRDISQQKKQEEQIRRTLKMDALGKLTGGIAHDYNNMLGVVLGYSELLSIKLNEQPKLKQYAEQIQSAAIRGAHLTSKLLSFSQSKIIDLKPSNINTLMLNTRDMLEKTLTPRITLVLNLEKSLWSTNLDEHDFENVIFNMCINAMHAIEGSGKLTINTHNKKFTPSETNILNLTQTDYILLTITDTGCGMSKETLDRLFDPFYTTKGDKGTGLGLSQVYGFVKGNGGSIEVNSTLGKGSEFTIYIPRIEGKSDSNDNKEIELSNTVNARGKETILVVDDEPFLVELCSEALSSKGYNVIFAYSSKECLEIIKTQHVDLLVSDVIMPEMDGYELTAIVQEQYPNIKIQLVSGFTGENHPLMAYNDLYKNLLLKPYKMNDLFDRVNGLLNDTVTVDLGG